MKLIIEHDTVLNIVLIEIDKINLNFSVTGKIKEISEIIDYDNGFITIQTNISEEYLDLIELLHNSSFSDSFINRVEKLVREIKISDIELRRCKMVDREQIENEAYLILQNIAFVYRVKNARTFLVGVNLKDTTQTTDFVLRDDKFLFVESNMSNEDMYKTMLIDERNNDLLLEGIKIWESTLKTK